MKRLPTRRTYRAARAYSLIPSLCRPFPDVDAMNTVLKYYEGYITTLSTRTMYDEAGCPHPWLDMELRRRLETKLIITVMTFKVA